jgi:hypothetical protein
MSAVLTTIHDFSFHFSRLLLILLLIFLSKISPFESSVYFFVDTRLFSFHVSWLTYICYLWLDLFGDGKGRKILEKSISRMRYLFAVFSLTLHHLASLLPISRAFWFRSLTHLYIRCLIPEAFRKCVLHYRGVQKL